MSKKDAFGFNAYDIIEHTDGRVEVRYFSNDCVVRGWGNTYMEAYESARGNVGRKSMQHFNAYHRDVISKTKPRRMLPRVTKSTLQRVQKELYPGA